MSELISLLTSPQFWLTFVVMSFVPYGFFIVAYVFESRRPGNGPDDVPVWRDQSRAFLPGDFGLVFVVSVCLQYTDRVTASWAHSLKLYLWALVVAAIVFVIARTKLYTPNDYSRTAWNSPTKRYHDFVMYGAFTFAAVLVCVPVWFGANFEDRWVVWLLSAAGLLVWLLGVWYDLTHNETPNQRQHPDRYKAIWQ